MKIQYLHFFELWILKLLGNKTFKIDSSYICTSNNVISVGKEFQYTEGSMLERVIIEDISWDKDHYDIKECPREHSCPIDQTILDSIPVIYL
jgi:hypothetical protein